MKLEIKHLAPYLPYDIFFKIIEGRIFKINANHIFNNHTGAFKGLDRDAKLLLRPLSQLTQEIEHKGQRFVPMDKLFELAFNTEINENKQYESKYDAHAIKATIDDESIVFAYWSNKKHFAAHWIEEDQVGLTIVENQYDLFQKLLEWHFDVNGLIENNLAEAISE